MQKGMSVRFKISNHLGRQLSHRSGDFLDYNRRDKLVVASGDRYRTLDYNPKWDKFLKGLSLTVCLVFMAIIIMTFNDLFFKEKTFRIPLYDQNYDLYRDETIGISLTCGLLELQKGNFDEAQRELQYYILNGEPNAQAALGMATTLVSRCELDDGYCLRAQEYITYAERVNKLVGWNMYNGSIEKLKERMEALPY